MASRIYRPLLAILLFSLLRRNRFESGFFVAGSDSTMKITAHHYPKMSVIEFPRLSVFALCFFLLLPLVSYIVYCEYKYRDLWGIPGPLVARYTNAWRCYLAYKHRERPTGVSYHQIIHDRYGDVVRVGPRTVFVRDPEAIPFVLGFKQRLEKSDSVIPFMVPGVRTSIVGIRNEQRHAAYRRPIQGAYSLSSLKAYEPAVNETIEKLISVLDEHVKFQKTINISAWCHYFSYDTIMRVTFGNAIGFMDNGKDMYDLIKNQIKHVNYVGWVTQMPILDYFLRTNPILLALKPHKVSPFFQFAVAKIKEKSQTPEPEGEERRTLLAHFLDAQRKYPDIVDDVQIRSYCSSNTLAGSLNPSKVMDLICRWLVTNPDAQERLYREIRDTGCDFPVSLESTLRMPYLEGVVRESYRLHKGADIAIERAVDPAGIELPSGRHLAYGTDVGLSTPAMRCLPVFGAEPTKYNPERWMRAKGETEENWRARRAAMERADLTFGAGSRACLGRNFTHLEVFKAVASIYGQFKFEAVKAPEKYDVQVKVTRRARKA